jgi:hypothetical protein
MTNKDNLNNKEIEFLKELLGPEKDDESINKKEKKTLKRDDLITKKKQSSKIIINFDKNNEQKMHDQSFEQYLSQVNEMILSNDNRKKIKKKELLLQIYSAIPLLYENNLLLKELTAYIKSIESSIRALTQEPLKIKVVK